MIVFYNKKTVHDVYLQQKANYNLRGENFFFIHCSLYITIEQKKTHAIFEKILKVFHLVIIHLSIPYGLKHISKPY